MAQTRRNSKSYAKRIVVSILAFAVVGLVSWSPAAGYRSHAIHKIVIDAGHGGKDPGNLGTGRYKSTEKDITLDVALRLGKYINEQFPEVEIVYTRDDDSFPSLKDRVNIANDSKADLFISVHCDAFTKSSAKGSGTYVMGMHRSDESLRVAMQENASIFLEEDYEQNYQGFDPADPDTYIALTLRQNTYLDHSLNFSALVQEQFRDRVGRVDRGVRQAGYYVICFTTMPSALIELGFLTNKEEEDFLNSENGKVYMASAIFRAFKQYKSQFEGIEIEEIKEETVEEQEVVEEIVEKVSTGENDIIDMHLKSGVVYKVQILTSSKALKKRAEEFKGLKNIEEHKINGVFKYMAGNTDNFDDAKKNQDILRNLGFSGAFVVAFKDGERINLHEANSLTN